MQHELAKSSYNEALLAQAGDLTAQKLQLAKRDCGRQDAMSDVPALSFWQDSWRRLRRNKAAMVSLIIILAFIILAILAPWIAPYSPTAQNPSYANLPPKIPGLEGLSWFNGYGANRAGKLVDRYLAAKVPAGTYYYLGTDALGRDLLSRILYGTRISLLIAFVAAAINLVFGVIYGLVSGWFGGKIDTLIGRDPHNRLKMAVVGFGGKKAVTHIKVLERYQSHSYIECALETGRTHQIRVHMREAKHPLAADPVYGNPRHPCSDAVKEAVQQLGRQALHAYRLSFVHPESGETVQFEAPLPEDIHHLLSVLRWECGIDSALSHTLPPAEPDDEDDWDEDDYDVETIYVHD